MSKGSSSGPQSPSPIELLSMSSPDPAHQLLRINLIERDIGLLAKGCAIALLLYFLYWSNWVSDSPINPNIAAEKVTWCFAQRVLQYVFMVYVALNFGVAFVLLGVRQVPLPLVQWTVFLSALVDGLFLGMLIVVTGGIESSLYWLYLGLVLRNSLSVSATVPQVVLNLVMCLAYTGGVLMDVTITRMDDVAGPEQGGIPAAAPVAAPGLGMAFALRLLLMVAVAAWCWTMQVLLDRQRRREEEQKELALRRQQLEASGRLAAEIAHQLKNPLAIINNASYTLQRTVREGKTITQQIQIIREEVEKSDRLITELMGYAQLSEGRVDRLDVRELLEEALLQVFPPAVKYEIQIHREYAMGLPHLLAQRSHLIEILINVLQNSREATGGRGNLWITTDSGEDTSIIISIADDGPGIAPGNLERIFEPYYSTREKGTGLGLAIVKHNVEMYGGRVAVESTLGKGARFILTFPARALVRLQP